MDLETAWYLVMGVSILMYTVLDGFDLGVGALHLCAKTDQQRRIFINAIGPVWDGNEVWIVIIMGGLFAGFPNAYATIFSGFYTLLMFLIPGLMFRAAAIEFRSKTASKVWRQIWDCIFAVSSILVGFVIGVILGNLILGVPLDSEQNFIGTFADFFRPYAILVGLLAVSLFAMHGAIYLYMKTDGEAHDVVRKWILPSIIIFVFFFAVTTTMTLLYLPDMFERHRENPLLWILPLLAIAAIVTVPIQVRKDRGGRAFVSSCVSIMLLLCLFHIGTYPYILHSTINPEINSLTIYNTAASKKTLGILMIVVAIGIPMVFAYGFWVYRVFRGKVRLDSNSY
jgi:cytochrome d ubiquinol oxidase subunit II